MLAPWPDGGISDWTSTTLPQGETRRISLDAAKEELDGLMRASVREHLVSDVPLGVWASGGLDSSAVLHYAATEMPERLKTLRNAFAATMKDPEFVSDVKNSKFELDPEDGDHLQSLIAKIYATPKAIVVRIHEILAKQLATPENQQLFLSQGHEPGGDTPEEYAAFIRAETEKWVPPLQSGVAGEVLPPAK